jgi:hypothetical protein
MPVYSAIFSPPILINNLADFAAVLGSANIGED